MIAIDQLTDQQFEQFTPLKCSSVNWARTVPALFLRLNRSGLGDASTADRDKWQNDLLTDQVLESIPQKTAGAVDMAGEAPQGDAAL